MRLGIILAPVVLAATVAFVLDARAAQVKPAANFVFLVGDSTVAGGSGWGDAYCSRARIAGKTCINMAVAGASTKSFRESGQWQRVLDAVKAVHGDRKWVLIQFGHNDQPGKGARSTDLATEFPDNIRRFVADVEALDAVPIIVTPLSRRHFVSGRIRNDLSPWAEKMKHVAVAQQVPLIDLNTRSEAALNAMGALAAQSLGPTDGRCIAEGSTDIAAVQCNIVSASGRDETHLGPKGAEYFATMVMDMLLEAEHDVRACEARLHAQHHQPE